LFISTGDTVTICSIKRRDPNEAKAKDLPEHLVEITHKFTIKDQWVCGVAPMNQVEMLSIFKKYYFYDFYEFLTVFANPKKISIHIVQVTC